MAAPSGGQVEEMGALQLLVKEYEEYKKKYTESLMFNATASSSNYGGFGIASFFLPNLIFCQLSSNLTHRSS